MSLRDDIRQAIAGAAGVKTLVSTRVYWLRAPLSVVAPYVILSVVTEVRDMTLTGNVTLARARVQVDSYAESFNTAVNLDTAIRAAMAAASAFACQHAIALEMFEDDARLYRISSEYSLFHSNP
jgi:meiotically up-regulated gene 157 (Mug157) protein